MLSSFRSGLERGRDSAAATQPSGEPEAGAGTDGSEGGRSGPSGGDNSETVHQERR
jgi:hypothetical protein